MVARKVHTLHQRLRYAIQEQDVAGLRPLASDKKVVFVSWAETASVKLARTEDMVQNTIDASLLSPPDWTSDLVKRSILNGLDQAGKELGVSVDGFDTEEVTRLHSAAAASEVRGIAAETERRLLRHAVHALENKLLPETLMREVRNTLEKITRARLILMINMVVVRAVNAGKLFTYEVNGVTKVGIDPEWLPPKPRRKQAVLDRHHYRHQVFHDHALHDEELVNVLTAGDNDVCEDCDDIATDGPYDIDEARDLIPAHANCRCAFVPFWDRRFAAIEEQEE